MSARSKIAGGFGVFLCGVCMCAPCMCVGFLQVLQFPSIVKKHACLGRLETLNYTYVCVCVCTCFPMGLGVFPPANACKTSQYKAGEVMDGLCIDFKQAIVPLWTCLKSKYCHSCTAVDAVTYMLFFLQQLLFLFFMHCTSLFISP